MLIISTAYDAISTTGKLFWGSKYLEQIKKFLPSDIKKISEYPYAILYFAKPESKYEAALNLKIQNIELTNNFFKLHYDIVAPLDYKSYQIKYALKKYLNLQTTLELPYCAYVDKNKFFDLIKNSSLIEKIKHYEENNDWESIYNLMLEIGSIENSAYWNDPIILNKFAFATAKLAECSENLKEKFNNKKDMYEYLKTKRKFRKLTIKLRNRIIECDPNNPAAYSNLAYSYYLSAIELTYTKGRRDGNIIEEAEKAIEYINKALTINYKRLTDHYRRGYLYFEILSNTYLNKKLKGEIDVIYDYLNNALESYEALVDIYENQLSKEDKIRYHKYYVKSLYDTALINLKLSKVKIDLMQSVKKITYANSKEFLDKSEEYMRKCIVEDSSNKQGKIIEIGTKNNFIIGVYKLYTMGKILVHKFYLTNNSEDYHKAYAFLIKALNTEYPAEMRRQYKYYVFNLLAILYLLDKKNKDAINLLEPLYKREKFFPYFIAYTLAIAYYHNKEFNKVKEIVEKYANNKSRMESAFLKLGFIIDLFGVER